MSTVTATADHRRTAAALVQLRPASVAYRQAFAALLQRDLHVLFKSLPLFIVRTVMQPLLLMFVFTYVFPKIGQGVGGGRRRGRRSRPRSSPASSASPSCSRASRPSPSRWCRSSGTPRRSRTACWRRCRRRRSASRRSSPACLNSLFAALLVFPIAYIVPATTVHLHIHWLTLLTLALLAGWVAAALGLVLGTKVAPQQVSYLFALVVLPITFLGCIYYPWRSLEAVRWLQIAVLINPLVYMCEGFRAALTTGTPHMSLWAVYGAPGPLRRRADVDRHRRLRTSDRRVSERVFERANNRHGPFAHWCPATRDVVDTSHDVMVHQ